MASQITIIDDRVLMIIYLGADHRGFALKERLKELLKSDTYTFEDLGAAALDPADDFPDFAAAVAKKVSADPEGSRGIVLCGSGFGVDIVANKFPNVRSALAMSPDHAYQGRHDDNVNVLSVAADFTDEATVLKMVKVFLTTPFAKEERYDRRLRKINDIESNTASNGGSSGH